MEVRDLIAKLLTYPQDAEVARSFDDNEFDWDDRYMIVEDGHVSLAKMEDGSFRVEIA